MLVSSKGGMLVFELFKESSDCSKRTPVPQLAFFVAKTIRTDGPSTWAVVGSLNRGNFTSGQWVDTPVTGDASSEASVALNHYSLRGGAPGDLVSLDGKVLAKGCGALPESIPANPQKALSFEVAGQKIEVMYATLKREKEGDTLTIGTGPLSWTIPPELNYRLFLKKDRSATVNMDGALVKAVSTELDKNHSPNVKIGAAKGESTAVSVDLEHEMFGYKIKLKGQIQARKDP